MFRIHVMVSGKVQRVWFRKQTQAKALELGLNGWVKNLFTNAVEIIAEGKPEEICEIKHSYTGNFLKPMLNNKFKKTA